MPIFYQKYVYSLKNALCSQAHILLKKHAFSKKLYSHVIFSQIFDEKPSAVKPLFYQKTVNSVKTTLYFGFKKSMGDSCFPVFQGKMTVVIPIFCQKTSIL